MNYTQGDFTQTNSKSVKCTPKNSHIWGPRTYHKEQKIVAGTRSSALNPNEEKPFVGEPKLPCMLGKMHLTQQGQPGKFNGVFSWHPKFITPEQQFFVRSHGPVPKAGKQACHKITFLMGKKCKTWHLRDLLSRFPFLKRQATLMCAGNRRSQLAEQGGEGGTERPIEGVPWNCGGIGNGLWGGISLRQVLLTLLPKDLGKNPNIEFEGADFSPEEVGRLDRGYIASLPLKYILADIEDNILLCTEQNGCPLTPDHGYPLRLVVPGVIGARSVKWLTTIRLIQGTSKGFFMEEDYKLLNPDISEPTLEDWKILPPAYDFPVTSCISQALQDLKTGTVAVCGYAAAGGGRKILRVVVNGREATLEQKNGWTWCLWKVEFKEPVPFCGEVCCSATDNSGNVQPLKMEQVWNAGGIFGNAIDCSDVHFKGKKCEERVLVLWKRIARE